MANPKTGTSKRTVETLIPQGTGQTTATAINGIWAPALILASGNATGGVRLPAASKGKEFFIKNTNPLQMGILFVYPAVGDTIDQQGVNNVLQLQPLASVLLIAGPTHTWQTLPLTTS